MQEDNESLEFTQKKSNKIKNILIVILSLIIIVMGFFSFKKVSSLQNELANFNRIKEQVDEEFKKIGKIDEENFFLECRDNNLNLIYNGSCNEYINNLDDKCEDFSEKARIFDVNTQSCIDITEYKTSLIACTIFNGFCGKHVKYNGYSPYEYASYKDLFEFQGNKDSASIIIFSQGGPEAELLTNYVHFLHEDYLVAYTYQVNILKPLLNSYNVSLKDARLETKENTKIIHEVYLGLKEEYPNKKFILMGHSMGSFQVLDYLSTYGNPFFKVVHLAGRLNFEDDLFIKHFLKNQEAYYIDFFPEEKLQEKNSEYYEKSKSQKSRLGIAFYDSLPSNLILASLGRNNYIKLLENVDLTNFLSYTSDKDEQLGNYSAEEIDFLKRKGATHYYIQEDTDNVGGHSAMLLGEGPGKIIDFIEN